MTFEQIIFVLVSAATLGTGLIVVTNRNLFRAALAMMASFLGVAGLYIMLDAGFMAAAQLLVYIGAISILIIFAIMMTRRMMKANEPSFNSQPLLALFTAVASFALIVAVVVRYWPFGSDANMVFANKPDLPASVFQASIPALGRAFVSANSYVLPFEIASMLLLAALIGSIIVAWPSSEEEA
ncbi:MAG: NADH-quinone oxidoreductase subunit J [Anaerolineales bacterium]|nr:NADH-quinone oxidoreductase subunit J [Anaerolineales bacterium]